MSKVDCIKMLKKNSIIVVLAVLLLVSLAYSVSLTIRYRKMSHQLIELKSLAVQLAVDKAELKKSIREGQIQPVNVKGVSTEISVGEGCVAVMEDPSAWNDNNKVCTDVSGKTDELKAFCGEYPNGNFIYSSPSYCIFN